MSPLSVPNFSPIRTHIRVLFRILQSVRKEEVEEKKPKLWPLVSRKWLERGVRHFLEGRTRFRNHSDFSEINDFISDFMISIVIS